MINSIEVRNARKFYGDGDGRRAILDGLNMNVKPGSIYSLIGASGCGKTTLLSCVLGMKKLDEGTIKVLGHRVKHEKPPKVAHRIGYMPQSTALIPELTIREILLYFGNIFQMNKKLLADRSRMVTDLLELPNENRKIENLSGGQQRRVSIAASIIHDPLILILDEPTVGLDSLLRDKIWNFLLTITRTGKISVVITTHYISEAEKSDRCGLMRDGALLREDSPKNIMACCGAETLDEAFLNLCLLKTTNLEEVQAITTIDNQEVEETILEGTIESFEKRKKFSMQTIGAMFVKELIRISRQKGEIFFILFMPILQMLAFAYAIGGNPTGLKVGIVNYEQPDYKNCSYYLSQNASYSNNYGECVYNEKASCHFLNEIRDDDAVKVFYDSYDDAFRDAKAGKLFGIISLVDDFTSVMLEPNDGAGSKGKIGITIQVDQSNYHISNFLQYRLFRAYQRFNKKMFRGCGQNEKAQDVPLNFEETIYGSLNNNFRGSMFGPIIMQTLFFTSFGFSCFSIAQSRIDGMWNRTLLAGVKSIEIFITQNVLGFLVSIVAFIESVIVAVLTLDIVMLGGYTLLGLFGFLLCLSGSVFGVAMSTTSEDIRFISMFIFALIQLLTVLNGSLWPIEGQPVLLRYLSGISPTTLPAVSVRNIMLKGYGIAHPSVYIGIIVLVIWVVLSAILALIMLKKRKFTE